MIIYSWTMYWWLKSASYHWKYVMIALLGIYQEIPVYFVYKNYLCDSIQRHIPISIYANYHPRLLIPSLLVRLFFLHQLLLRHRLPIINFSLIYHIIKSALWPGPITKLRSDYGYGFLLWLFDDFERLIRLFRVQQNHLPFFKSYYDILRSQRMNINACDGIPNELFWLFGKSSLILFGVPLKHLYRALSIADH